MASKLVKLFAIDRRERILFFYGLYLNGIFRLMVIFIPVRRYAKRLGAINVESPFITIEFGSEPFRSVLLTLRRIFRNAPWRQTCFSRAFTAKKLLEREGISSTLYLGVAKDDSKNLIAHAWLRCGDKVVVGREEMPRFTPVVFFT